MKKGGQRGRKGWKKKREEREERKKREEREEREEREGRKRGDTQGWRRARGEEERGYPGMETRRMPCDASLYARRSPGSSIHIFSQYHALSQYQARQKQ
eukprot:986833-Rhodomonas_salina.1